MLKKTAFPALALLAATVGFYVRKQELLYEFEDFSGLAVTDGRWTRALIVISAAVFALAAAAAVFGRAARRKRTEGGGDYSAFAFAASAIGGAMVAIGSLLVIKSDAEMFVTNTVRYIFAAFGVLSGVGMVALAAYCRFGYDGAVKQLDVVLPVFLCFWMVLIFHDNASNPVILDFCFECLAMGASSMATIYIAGYTFGRENPAWTMLFSVLAIFFLGVAAAGAEELPIAAAIVGTALFVFANAMELPIGFGKGEYVKKPPESGKKSGKK